MDEGHLAISCQLEIFTVYFSGEGRFAVKRCTYPKLSIRSEKCQSIAAQARLIPLDLHEKKLVEQAAAFGREAAALLQLKLQQLDEVELQDDIASVFRRGDVSPLIWAYFPARFGVLQARSKCRSSTATARPQQ